MTMRWNRVEVYYFSHLSVAQLSQPLADSGSFIQMMLFKHQLFSSSVSNSLDTHTCHYNIKHQFLVFPPFPPHQLLQSKWQFLLTFYISSFLLGGLKLMFQSIVLAMLFKNMKCHDCRRCRGYSLLHMVTLKQSMWAKHCKVVFRSLIFHLYFSKP